MREEVGVLVISVGAWIAYLGERLCVWEEKISRCECVAVCVCIRGRMC